ncbi:FecR family protein [Aquimarina sp. MAR_2010_214]|uniref:FecR family protein n=1 Tax=Aquimarina sp. MAR_2010_214 TaxID=1250026 RepID=UPI000C710C61|nr:FecR domain-containing protein [Aquimarina sp. MAR_2010_214]PKV53172.1 FecR family protein [Aquimarina sp. MAR_2010_214]
MANFNDADNFLAKWANGDLSEDEKEDFKKTKEYKLYATILEGTESLDVPVYDNGTVFEGVQEKINKKGKVIQLVPKWVYTVAAASVALLIGSFLFFSQTVNYKTTYGEKLAITLPDNSEVILNSKSKLEHKKKNWEAERKLILEGEAYFKVTKGSTFTVDSDNGKVTVIGTQFTINSQKDIFEVVCYEGKVKVEENDLQKIITKGQGIRIVDGLLEDWNFEIQEPSWVQDETTFNNAPIQQVVIALEKHYGITIHLNDVNTDRRYTGGFTQSDLETALRTVFESLEIKYQFKNKSTIDLVQD